MSPLVGLCKIIQPVKISAFCFLVIHTFFVGLEMRYNNNFCHHTFIYKKNFLIIKER